MLLTENYNNAFEFVKVIIQNIGNPDIVKTAFLMTSQLRQNYLMIYANTGQSFLIFSKVESSTTVVDFGANRNRVYATSY